jgi:hypothetical protein
MGNCFQKNQEEEEEEQADKELNTGVRGTLTVMTFAGPQDYLGYSENDAPPTFSDPIFFSNSKKTIALNSFSEDSTEKS